jgi:hypothetical protein
VVPPASLLAFVALIVVALLPLLVGVGFGQQRETTVLLADLVNHRRDPKLVEALREAPQDAVLVIMQGRRDMPYCGARADEDLCLAVTEFHRQITVQVLTGEEVERSMIVDSLYGAGPAPEGDDGLFVTSRPAGPRFAMLSAFLAALSVIGVGFLAILLAPALVIWWTSRRVARRVPARHPGRPPLPSEGLVFVPDPGQPRQRGPAPPPRPQPPPAADPPVAGRPPEAVPVVGITQLTAPAPATTAIRTGSRVVARTHFGPDGGYVETDGLVLWARLDQPRGRHPRPGQTVVVVAQDAHDPLTVSLIDR